MTTVDYSVLDNLEGVVPLVLPAAALDGNPPKGRPITG